MLVAPGLVALGLLGGGTYDERYEAKQIVVTPIGEDGVRITEIVDDDFGTTERHGYQRFIPNDFGQPQDIVVRASNVNDDVSVTDMGDGQPEFESATPTSPTRASIATN